MFLITTKTMYNKFIGYVHLYNNSRYLISMAHIRNVPIVSNKTPRQ